MFSQLAKRSPWALVCGEFSILLTPRTYRIFPPVNILEARSEPAEEIRNGQKIEKKNHIVHLCISCISYLSFGTVIAGETKTQQC